jgi:hypothetical protein
MSYLLVSRPPAACWGSNAKEGRHNPVRDFPLANSFVVRDIVFDQSALTRRTTGCGGKGSNDL